MPCQGHGSTSAKFIARHSGAVNPAAGRRYARDRWHAGTSAGARLGRPVLAAAIGHTRSRSRTGLPVRASINAGLGPSVPKHLLVALRVRGPRRPGARPARLVTHWAYNRQRARRPPPRTIDLAGTSAAWHRSWRAEQQPGPRPHRRGRPNSSGGGTSPARNSKGSRPLGPIPNVYAPDPQPLPASQKPCKSRQNNRGARI